MNTSEERQGKVYYHNPSTTYALIFQPPLVTTSGKMVKGRSGREIR